MPKYCTISGHNNLQQRRGQNESSNRKWMLHTIRTGSSILPLENDGPSDDLQEQGNATKNGNCNDVSHCPFMIDAQYLHAFEDVDNAQDDDRVSHQVMIDVPNKSILVILARPQKQCKDL